MFVITHYDDGRNTKSSHEVAIKNIVYKNTMDLNGESYPIYDNLFAINITNRTRRFGRTYEEALNGVKDAIQKQIIDLQLLYHAIDAGTISPIEIDGCGQIIEEEITTNA